MANLRANKITSTEVFETTGSVQFVRVPTSRLTTDLGSGLGDNFTIEFWIIANGIASGSSSPGMFQLSDTSGGLKASTESLALAWSTSNNYSIFYAGSLGTGSITNDPNTNDVWKHYAMVRSNGVLKIYVDGIEKTSANVTDDFSGYRYLSIGTYYSTSYPWQGHISNFRILKGTALYTKNFTPPTRELTVISNTVLLACQSTTNTAQEATGKTITVNGNAVANELTPGLLTDVVKSGGTSAITGSVEFDGTDNTLTIPNNADFNFGSGDSTIEMWVYPTRISATQENLITRGTSGYSGFIMSVTNFLDTTSGSNWDIDITYTNPLVANSWQHIAVCRNGNTWTVYINGIANGTATASGAVLSSAQTLTIGERIGQTDYQGFISNLRVVKGTALYTSNFIPPTRELKNIPGTVLLCCKDSNDPTAEETGKTITGYGDLQRADDVELITNGSFAGDFTGWTNGNPSQFTYSTDSVGGDTSGKLKYVAADSNLRTFTQYVTCVTGQKYNLSFVASSNASNAMVIDIDGTNVVTIDNNSNANLARYNHVFTAGSTSVRIRVESAASNTSYFDNFSVTLVDGSNKGSNFTPQVGSDGSVEFAGPTKINSENYFYLPTGNTESRGRGRGVFGGGYTPSNLNSQDIQYVNITSSGNAIDFGELTTLDKTRGTSSCSSSTRGVWGGGYSAPLTENTNIINYVTIASTGNALDFGELFIQKERRSSLANSTRGIFGGGSTDPTGPSNTVNNIDYLTIASTGNALDFGDLTVQRGRLCATSSSTRGLFSLGTTDSTANTNTIDYITIASSGNAVDFGDMSYATSWPTALSSSIRGVFAGGAFGVNTIEYVTIASTGNSQDFGDATQGLFGSMGTSNGIKGLIAGNITSLEENRIEYITIATTGNGQDFGDLVKGITVGGACSDSHGGLG
jgi:hypothetical protein